jgi:hypothetical protein
MDEEIARQLAEETQPEWATELLNSTRDLVDMSRRKMATYYTRWDANNDVYRGYREQDTQDKKAKDRKEPEKMVVPVTYSQTQTFVSFLFALYTQRDRFFELSGTNERSHQAAKNGEALLQRDLVFNLIEAKLYQLLVDIARFSMGVMKVSWVRKTQWVNEEIQIPAPSLFGFKLGANRIETQRVLATKYLGNELFNVSPYRFFPDVRLPLTRFQEGEFCASEDEFSYVQLEALEADGVIAGLEHVKDLTKQRVEDRGGVRIQGFTVPDEFGANQKRRGTVIITEVQRVITPSKFELDGRPLDKNNNRPTKYLIWYANDGRIVRFEPLGYLHDEFTYTVAQFSPDNNEFLGMGLADTIDQLQSVITWFINSRITNVRKVIQNFLVVDTTGVEIRDLENRNPVIRLKADVGGRGIDRYIKQLNVTDVTTNHIGDAKFLQDLVQLTTGINENMLGQVSTGRRSAREMQNTFTSAVNRLKMTGVLIFRSCLEPMGRQMLSNLRDGLDEAVMVKLLGVNNTIKDQAGFKPVSKMDLVGSYDFDVFDGTLPSEKAAAATVFEELIKAFASNPQAAIALGIDPKAVMIEWMELRGVRNTERFFLSQPPAPGVLTPPVPGQPQPPQIPV